MYYEILIAVLSQNENYCGNMFFKERVLSPHLVDRAHNYLIMEARTFSRMFFSRFRATNNNGTKYYYYSSNLLGNDNNITPVHKIMSTT